MGLNMDKSFSFGFGGKYPRCCGRDAGCARIDEDCAYRNSAWKRAVVKGHPLSTANVSKAEQEAEDA